MKRRRRFTRARLIAFSDSPRGLKAIACIVKSPGGGTAVRASGEVRTAPVASFGVGGDS